MCGSVAEWQLSMYKSQSCPQHYPHTPKNKVEHETLKLINLTKASNKTQTMIPILHNKRGYERLLYICVWLNDYRKNNQETMTMSAMGKGQEVSIIKRHIRMPQHPQDLPF